MPIPACPSSAEGAVSGAAHPLDEAAFQALATDLTVDVTTTGARTGEPRRIEIWLLHVDGRFFITGTPGHRDWLANLQAHPALTVHLKQRVKVDVPAQARAVLDESTRREVLSHPAASWYRDQAPLDVLVASSPMVELTFSD
jgi:deazaflavin-dependent oxidoreductase (nitroreductase family)